MEKLEKDSKTFNIKYDDLIKVFTEPSFIATSNFRFFYNKKLIFLIF